MTYEDFFDEWDSPCESITCKTSGSTGNPAVIELPKKEMVKSALRTIEYFSLDSTSKLYSCISPDYIGGKMMGVRQRVCNCRLEWEIPSNRPLGECSAGDVIDLISVVPSQLNYILANPEGMPKLNNILVGGAPLSEETRNLIMSTGANVFESYGMTETASHIAIKRIGDGEDFFHTLPGIEVYDKDGCLAIGIEGWKEIVTNDCVELISADCFRILGRRDNVINSGGIKIHPELIESKLTGCFQFPFAITSRPDSKWGEAVVFAAKCRKDEIPLIEIKLAEVLSKYERPKSVVSLSEIPLTGNGKINRVELKRICK